MEEWRLAHSAPKTQAYLSKLRKGKGKEKGGGGGGWDESKSDESMGFIGYTKGICIWH